MIDLRISHFPSRHLSTGDPAASASDLEKRLSLSYYDEQSGLLPREVLKFLQIIADTKPLAGMEIVECSPPYDAAEITSIMATRVICDVLACQVRSGNLIQPEETLSALTKR